MSVVLVTGASSGFGRLTVEALAARGHTVFAGVRDIAGRNAKAAAELENVVEIDVTDQASADRAIAEVVASAGRLDVIVNNAGANFVGPLEAYTAEEAARQLDLNVLGALRVNRAALPVLRAQGDGVLIQVSSNGDRVTVPYNGLYSASKAALASLTEAWSDELRGFGVESVLVEPASYPTNIGLNASLPSDQERMNVYAEGWGAFFAVMAGKPVDEMRDPREVADAIVRLIETPKGERPMRTVVGPPAESAALRELNRTAASTAATVASGMGIAEFVGNR